MTRASKPSAEMMAYIDEQLYVDPVTGKVLYTYDNPYARAAADEPAGYLRPDGRRIIHIKGRAVYASQIAAYFYKGKWPTQRVWVIGEDKDDLRPDNIFVGSQHPHTQRNIAARQREDDLRRREQPWTHVKPSYWQITVDQLNDAYRHMKIDPKSDFNRSVLRQWLKEMLNIHLGGGGAIPGTDIAENRIKDTKFEAMSIEELEKAIKLFS